jgi:hypothetical protein
MKPHSISALLALALPFAAAGKPEALFDGEDLSKWTMDKAGAWTASGGELHPSENPGGYIWTRDKFEDFTLELEFKMSAKCNSGVFFRTDPKNAVQGGFEIQVMDTAANEKMGTHDCGALYDAMAPSSNATRPAGEWNSDVDIDDWDTAKKNPDGTKNKFKTALKDIARNNHIGLQFHGHPVWYRNIRIERH